MPEIWQLSIILAAWFTAWFAAAWLFDRRQAARAAAETAMNELLLNTLQELFEQRERKEQQS